MADNVILGMAENYTFDRLSPFFGSLRKTGFSGEVYLFARRMNFIEQAALKEYGAHIVLVNKKFPFYKKGKGVFPDPAGNFDCLRVEYYRFIIYYGFLKSRAEEFRGKALLLTDTRDVVFQRDPFGYGYDPRKIYFFAEKKDVSIKDNDFNALWVRHIYGDSVLEAIGDNRCICSGMMLGAVDPIMSHLEKMIRHMRNVHDAIKGGDQAIHEFVVYTESGGDFKILNNEDGPCVHLHTVADKDVNIDEDGYVRNENGLVASIVHQYDRHPFLMELFQKKYALKKSHPNIVFWFLDRIFHFFRRAERLAKDALKYALKRSGLAQ